jgi:hypothetical protein
MLKILKKVVVLFAVCCFCVGTLASCGVSVNGDIKAFINEFFALIMEGKYEEAEEYLHPSLPADLKSYIEDIERAEKINFYRGIKIEKYTSYSYTEYDAALNGAVYKVEMITYVGLIEVQFKIDILENGSGRGICAMNVNA